MIASSRYEKHKNLTSPCKIIVTKTTTQTYGFTGFTNTQKQ